MCVGILSRDIDLAGDFCVESSELTPSRDFENQFARGQKTIGNQIKLRAFLAFAIAFLL